MTQPMPCRTCGHPTAVTARSCPQCGERHPHARVDPSGERHELVTVLFALLVAGVAITVISVLWK